MEKKIVLWQLGCLACGGINGTIDENYTAD